MPNESSPSTLPPSRSVYREHVAEESPINDGWFVGEDKTLHFTITGEDVGGISGWAMEWAVYRSRARSTEPPLLTVLATGVAPTALEGAKAVVPLSGEQSAALGPGIYQHVLRRIDPGFRTVLSFGSAKLRSAVTA